MQNNEPIWFGEGIETIDLSNKPAMINPKYKIMVCTPMHSGASIHYVQSMLKFQQACIMQNIVVSFTLLKSSLVQQGRNLCVADFISHKDNYTHLLFIDSDIDFQHKTIFTMLEKDKDIIACPYPMKFLDWDKMFRKLQKHGAKDSNHMSKLGFTFPIKMKDPKKFNVEEGLVEVTHAPTGCMLIKREVIEKMIKAHPELEIYQPTFINGKETKKPNMYNLFECLHDPKTKRYYGEDFGFCQRWLEMGGKTYLYVLDYITHVGDHQYCGRFWDELTDLKTVDPVKKIK